MTSSSSSSSFIQSDFTNFDPASALFILGTTNITAFRNIVSTINTFSQDETLMINPQRKTVSMFATDGKLTVTYFQFPGDLFNVSWHIHRDLADAEFPSPISDDIWNHTCCNARVALAMRSYLKDGPNSLHKHNFVNQNTAESTIRIPVRTNLLDTAISCAQTQNCERLYLFAMRGNGKSKLHIGFVVNGVMVTHQIPIAKVAPIFSFIRCQQYDYAFVFDAEEFKAYMHMLNRLLHDSVQFDVCTGNVLRISSYGETESKIHFNCIGKHKLGNDYVTTSSDILNCGPFSIEHILIFFKRKLKKQLVTIYLSKNSICFECLPIDTESSRIRQQLFEINVQHLSNTKQPLSKSSTQLLDSMFSKNLDSSLDVQNPNPSLLPPPKIRKTGNGLSQQLDQVFDIRCANGDTNGERDYKLLYSVYSNTDDIPPTLPVPSSDEDGNVWE